MAIEFKLVARDSDKDVCVEDLKNHTKKTYRCEEDTEVVAVTSKKGKDSGEDYGEVSISWAPPGGTNYSEAGTRRVFNDMKFDITDHWPPAKKAGKEAAE